MAGGSHFVTAEDGGRVKLGVWPDPYPSTNDVPGSPPPSPTRNRRSKTVYVALVIMGVMSLIAAAGFAIHGVVEKFTDAHWIVISSAGGGGLLLFIIGLIGLNASGRRQPHSFPVADA